MREGQRITLSIKTPLSTARGLNALLAALLLCAPAIAHAQYKMSSSSYELEDINFATNIGLSTSAVTPPRISSEGPHVTKLTANTATIEWSTDSKARSAIQYGTTSDYGFEVGTTDLVTEHSVTLTGLKERTTYHFRAKSTSAHDISAYSEDFTLTTLSQTGITSIQAHTVGYKDAFISFASDGMRAVTVHYGTTTNYGLTKAVSLISSSSGENNVQLTDLTPGVTYHFRLVGEDQHGDELATTDGVFSTLAEPRITSFNVNASEDRPNEVDAIIRTNVFTTAIISYKSDKEEKSLSGGSSTLTDLHTVNLPKLFGNTTYTASISVTDRLGTTVSLTGQTFKTPSDTRPPVFTSLKASTSRTDGGIAVSLKAVTDEPALYSAIIFPKNNTEKTTEIEETRTFASEQTLVTTELDPSTTYQALVKAKDAGGLETEQAINFVTPSRARTFLSLLLENIARQFSWLQFLFGGN